MGVAREPGSRSKIAVTTRDSDVDPVGACVGIKGSRVQAVVQELRGEKIDITMPFDRDPARYIINADSAGRGETEVIVDEADHRMELVVPDEKLSLAIGRKGQNVRLASQLTGWKLDIISEKQVQADGGRSAESCSRRSTTSTRSWPRPCTASAFALWRKSPRPPSRSSSRSRASPPEERAPGAQGRRQEAPRSACVGIGFLPRLHRWSRSPERDGKLRFVPGVGTRTVQLLEEAGYRTVQDLAREDADRLAIRTGLGIKKARQIQVGASHFLSTEARGNRRGTSPTPRQPRAAAAAASAADAAHFLPRREKPLKGVKGRDAPYLCWLSEKWGTLVSQPLVRSSCLAPRAKPSRIFPAAGLGAARGFTHVKHVSPKPCPEVSPKA